MKLSNKDSTKTSAYVKYAILAIILVIILLYLWSKNLIDLNAFALLIISAVGAFVSIQQYKLRKMEHRFNLYRERVEVYKIAYTMIRTLREDGEISDFDKFKKQYESLNAGRFLFPAEARWIFDEIYEIGIDIDRKNALAMGCRNEMANLHSSDDDKILRARLKEYTDRINIHFEKLKMLLNTLDGLFDKILSITD